MRNFRRLHIFEFSSFFHFHSFFVFFSFSFFFLNPFLFLVFLSNTFHCWHQYQSKKTVSSAVGAPWRCGVLSPQGGITGIGLGHLLGREHDSTHLSGMEAPRLLKRSLPRLYYCCCCCFRRVFNSVFVHSCEANASH